MPQLDLSTFPSQLFWLAVVFIVLYVLMARLGLPKIGTVLAERRQRIEEIGRASCRERVSECV